eukprot:TRINITY_DN3356_c0_g1_i5.p1 TRINITY_DN3356_c0_g1~~TRINITY_DN3356_c0_g1_i5.p1  ORF type:complete len:402 (-),score=56.45 TRINITY_DN3356_c0_g1_i5:10-1215(-)
MNHYGNTLISIYSSPNKLIECSYDEYPFASSSQISTETSKVAQGFWDNPDNVHKLLDMISDKLSIQRFSDYYNIPNTTLLNQITTLGGNLIQKYNGATRNLLIENYQYFPWMCWKFCRTPRFFWNRIDSHYIYMNDVSERESFKTFYEWYNVNITMIERSGGEGLLKSYKNSKYKMLSSLYPEYEWKPNLFLVASHVGYGDENHHDNEDENTAKKILQILASQLNINNLDDWYKVSEKQIRSIIPISWLKKYGGNLWNLLIKYYPNHPWNIKELRSKSKKSTQNILMRSVLHLFPNAKEEVIQDHRHPKLKYSDTASMMELDIFIPSINLAFEYQGHFHFNETEKMPSYGDLKTISKRDKEKSDRCSEEGITLIIVPYWWDQTTESLSKIIRISRPDLLMV